LSIIAFRGQRIVKLVASILFSMVAIAALPAGGQEIGQIRPTLHQVSSCAKQASKDYGVPMPAINAILAFGLAPGEIKNERAGPMGLPLEWIPVFEYMGIPGQSLISDGCQNVYAGVWLMAMQSAYAAGQAYMDEPAWNGRVASLTTTLKARKREWAGAVFRAAEATGVPIALIEAVITVESGYNQRAVSPAGAIGLMQLMPGTAATLGVNPRNGEENIMGGARYLAMLMRQFSNNLQLVLAAYNAGPAAVTKNGYRIPAFKETMAYVPKVMATYASLSSN